MIPRLSAAEIATGRQLREAIEHAVPNGFYTLELARASARRQFEQWAADHADALLDAAAREMKAEIRIAELESRLSEFVQIS